LCVVFAMLAPVKYLKIINGVVTLRAVPMMNICCWQSSRDPMFV